MKETVEGFKTFLNVRIFHRAGCSQPALLRHFSNQRGFQKIAPRSCGYGGDNWLSFLELHVHLGDDGSTAGAQTLGVGIYGVHPAAGALLALGFADTDGQCA